jgi:hypothetical protein
MRRPKPIMRLTTLAPLVSLLTLAAPRPRRCVGASRGTRWPRARPSRCYPPQMPAFFRAAGEQLVYLDPEPDRWRNRDMPEMDNAFSYDHYIDLENVPAGGARGPHRFAYLRRSTRRGWSGPERDGGFLPFRIVELYQRLVTEWRLWRAEADPVRRGWIEQRIINDAGVLGHYVTDASQPHHATDPLQRLERIRAEPRWLHARPHFPRALRERLRGRAPDSGSRERAGHRTRPLAGRRPCGEGASWTTSGSRTHGSRRSTGSIATSASIRRGPRDPETRDFAAERLAVGARMLADLWWSAWLESATAG